MLNGEWMVAFVAGWCPSCRSLKPNWEEFAKTSDDFSVKVGSIDVTKNPGLSGRFMITALPTIYHVKDGVFRQYTSTRDRDSLWSFIDEKKWKTIEPVSRWAHPASIQMTVVSWFFKISMVIRAIHTRLVEDYGIPSYGSYILFGLATILVGIVLSLVIVCALDFVFPAKMDGTRYEKLDVSGDKEAPLSPSKRKLRSSNKKDDEEESSREGQNIEEKKEL